MGQMRTVEATVAMFLLQFSYHFDIVAIPLANGTCQGAKGKNDKNVEKLIIFHLDKKILFKEKTRTVIFFRRLNHRAFFILNFLRGQI